MMSSSENIRDHWHVPDDWFARWFNTHYLKVYHHRSSEEAEDFVSRWKIWDKLQTGQWCLDLGCGSGRYSRIMAQKGLQVLGIDLSADLLNVAKSDQTVIPTPHYVRADMRNIPLKMTFDLILSLFTSFGYFQDDAEHLKILQNISRLLSPKGIFILDLPNKSDTISNVAENPFTIRDIDGYSVRETRRWDNSQNIVEKRIEIITDYRKETYYESVRLFSVKEIKEMLLSAGISLLESPWGDYSGSQLTSHSPRMIFFGAKK